ncbi:MAG: aminotransferase class IV family protein [Anaerolineales bacterium]|nr:aminotransferase class IV family protein [Anaerolineales bacterium]
MTIRTWKLSSEPPPSELIELPLAGCASLDEASSLLPGGAYTTFRTFERSKAVRLSNHFHRLEETAALAGQSIRLDTAGLRQALRQVISQQKSGDELRLRLTLDLEQQPGTFYISAQPLETPPPDAYQQGARVITTRLERMLPKAKLTRFIVRSSSVRQDLGAGINEAIMIDARERLLEGISSNFFAILEKKIRTAEEGVLSGITRSVVLAAADNLGIQTIFEPVTLADIPALDEAFITSSSRGILPVRQIDQVTIGPECPGPVTRLLMDEYSLRLGEQLEEI